MGNVVVWYVFSAGCWVYITWSVLPGRTPCLLDQVVHLAVHDCRRDFVCEAGGRGGVKGGSGGGLVELRVLGLRLGGILMTGVTRVA